MAARHDLLRVDPRRQIGVIISMLPASGQTALTRIPKRPSSSAATLVMPRTAHLLEA